MIFIIKLSEIITEELFLNAFNICKNYAEENFILDINFRLLQDILKTTSEEKMSLFYKKFIETDLVLSIPEFYSSDIIFIPKGMTSVREYRFFSLYSIILYNAIGLLFVECTHDLLKEIHFSKKNIFAYYPTTFLKENNEWKANNDYKENYSNFLDKLYEQITVGDVVLRLDITNYFEDIKHRLLINMLKKFSIPSILSKYNINSVTQEILEFYFASLMGKNNAIPQGRKNFLSDYLGYLYLVPFDVNVASLTKNKNLNFKSMIRYVDDIFITFTPNINLSKKEILKELLVIEQLISSWFYDNLFLSINSSKTKRNIIDSEDNRKKYLKFTKKIVSDPQLAQPQVNNQFYPLVHFKNSLRKLKFREVNEFDIKLSGEERENLKVIFDKKFQNYIFKPNVSRELILLLKEISFDLVAEYINILIVLFSMKSKKENVFRNIFIKFLLTKINLLDRRHIHILFLALAQSMKNEDKKKIKANVKKNKTILLENN
ncbi:hypothetical protein PaeCFBP13512_18840, partial [Paenibacillus sp. CFBP13512]|uniref:hypothetical protein n=1 Tax=Paenibacillus sp. CFBP13512 TaxID=2184007 RepID=UPI0010C05D06